MLSHYRWAEIADADLCLLNPFSEEKLHLLASISSGGHGAGGYLASERGRFQWGVFVLQQLSSVLGASQ